MKGTGTRTMLVATARGDVSARYLIQNVMLVDVLTGSFYRVDIGLANSRIAYVVPAGKGGTGADSIDGTSLYAVPGFVDGHVHNESSKVTPAQWAKELLARGTTTVFTDPHEIGNVLGLDGIRYMIDASMGLPLRYFITAPSCVPAVPGLETAGAVITAKEMAELLTWERVVAVAEAMDYMGLIEQKGNITPIVEVAHAMGIGVESHAPGVVGRMLQAYLAASGPWAADHESHGAAEMLEKVRAGMMVYARASTFLDASPHIAEALSYVTDARMFGMCTDDVMPHLLLSVGHLDYGIRRLIECGVPPMTAYQMASINVAQHYHIPGLGAIAPGWLADIVLLEDLETVKISHVFANGELVVVRGKLAANIREPGPPLMVNTMRIPASLNAHDFYRTDAPTGVVRFNGMDLTSIFTVPAIIEAEVVEGHLTLPLPEGVAIAAIVPRHGQGTAPTLCLITGYPITGGAVASTVSHDSHNLAIIGRDPYDMYIAARELERTGGGLTAVLNGQILATVELPIAGLMSPLTVAEVAAQEERLEAALPTLGLPAAYPIHLLALALPVVPQVRLTDRGLVDVATQKFIPVQAG